MINAILRNKHFITLKYLINKHKKTGANKEHCSILTRKNKPAYKKVPNK